MIVFVKEVGNAATKTSGASQSVTVPAAGVASGNTLVVFTVIAENTGTGPSCTDSRGNTYTNVTRDPLAFTGKIYICAVTTALISGDTITVGFSAGSNDERAMLVAEFSGVDTTGASVDTSTGTSSPTGTSATPSATITPSGATDLIVAMVGVNGPTGDTFTQDTDTNGGDSWHGLTRIGTSGGSQTSNVTLNTTYKITTSAISQTYDPSITSRSWRAQVVALLAAAIPASLVYDDRHIRRNSLLRR